MKKFAFLLIFFIGIACFSCSNEEPTSSKNEKTESIQKAFDELNQKIDDLNKNYDFNSSETRGRRWRRFWRIFSADAIGGVVGGGFLGFFGALFFGITGSLCAGASEYQETSSCIIPDIMYYIDRPYISASVNPDSLGIIHNDIIYEIYEEQEESMYTLSNDEIQEIILTKLEDRYGIRLDTYIFVMEDNVISKCNAMLDAMNISSESLEEVVDNFVQLYPDIKNELEIIKKFCINLEQLPKEVPEQIYAGEFTGIVMNSDIPEGSKNMIKMGINIGENSYSMWNKGEIKIVKQ